MPTGCVRGGRQKYRLVAIAFCLLAFPGILLQQTFIFNTFNSLYRLLTKPLPFLYHPRHIPC